jgi:hypothetical protein
MHYEVIEQGACAQSGLLIPMSTQEATLLLRHMFPTTRDTLSLDETIEVVRVAMRIRRAMRGVIAHSPQGLDPVL